jgi:hypothetical protein
VAPGGLVRAVAGGERRGGHRRDEGVEAGALGGVVAGDALGDRGVEVERRLVAGEELARVAAADLEGREAVVDQALQEGERLLAPRARRP